MSILDSLRQTIRRAIAGGCIGTPVAVRLAVRLASPAPDPLSMLATLLTLVDGWFESQVVGLAAMRSGCGRSLSVLAQYPQGQSASLSIDISPRGSYRCQALVFGNRGIANWAESADFSEPLLAGDEYAEGSGAGEGSRAAYRDWMEESLRSGMVARAASAESHPGPAEDHVRSRISIRDVFSCGHSRIVPTPPPYGVLLVAGDHTHQPGYAQAFAAEPRCQLVGLVDSPDVSPRRAELNARLARTLQIPLLDDLTAALQRPDVQIVSICAEPERRGPIICQAATAGKHLYLDKPLAGSANDIRDIVAAVQDVPIVTQMFSQMLWSPTKQARAILEQPGGRLGGLSAVHGELCFAKGHAGTADLGQPRRESPNPTQFELPQAKRELTNIGVYPIVMLLGLLRRPVRRLFASTGNYFFAEHQRHDLEDFGQLLLEFEGGVLATVTAGRTGWYSHPQNGINRITLIGDSDSIALDGFQPRCEIWSESAAWSAPPRDPEDPMAMWAASPGSRFAARAKTGWQSVEPPSWTTDVRHFVDCVEFGRASDVPATLAATAMDILFAAYQSAAEGRIVRLA